MNKNKNKNSHAVSVVPRRNVKGKKIVGKNNNSFIHFFFERIWLNFHLVISYIQYHTFDSVKLKLKKKIAEQAESIRNNLSGEWIVLIQ